VLGREKESKGERTEENMQNKRKKFFHRVEGVAEKKDKLNG